MTYKTVRLGFHCFSNDDVLAAGSGATLRNQMFVFKVYVNKLSFVQDGWMFGDPDGSTAVFPE